MTLVAALLVAPFFVLTCCFAIELLVGIRPLQRRGWRVVSGSAAVIVVPANNEEAIIGATMASLKEAAGEHAQIIVVADNCSDRTADVARDAGVHVIERCDPTRRGKGFALDFAKEYLRLFEPKIVIVIDADCTTDAMSIVRLIAACIATNRPCQAIYVERCGSSSSAAVQLSSFAFFIKNVIRQRALQRLAGRVHLVGTGMAFPWEIFDRAALATANIAEDLQLGLELAEAGHPPILVEEANVWSQSETETNTIARRRRWEGGFLKNAVQAAPRIVRRCMKTSDGGSVWAAINLMIPPAALLILADTVAIILGSFLVMVAGAKAWPPMLLAGAMLLAGLSLTLAWANGGRSFVAFATLARAPLYVLWKVPMYLSFARHGTPTDWIRTR